MMVRRHDLDPGAKAGPERPQLFHRAGVGAFGWREDAPAVDEQLRETGIRAGMLGAGHRMRRHEMNALRNKRRHLPDDRALDRADVGDNSTRFEESRDLLRDRATGADGNAEDDEVGVFDRL